MQTISFFSLANARRKQFSPNKKSHLHEQLSAIFSPLCVPVLLVLDECVLWLFSLFTRKSTLLLANLPLVSLFFFFFACSSAQLPFFTFSLRSIFVLAMYTVLTWMCERKPWMLSFVFSRSRRQRHIGENGWYVPTLMCAPCTPLRFGMETTHTENGRVSLWWR